MPRGGAHDRRAQPAVPHRPHRRPRRGKTTAADLFRREIGEAVVIVRESATLLFSGGFPREDTPFARRAIQQAIYHVQRNLEDVQTARYPDRILLCDRGTIDGAAYWPGRAEDFFTAVGSTYEAELARYDAVLFFESAAVGGIGIENGNPARVESIAEAARLDGVMRGLWQPHPLLLRPAQPVVHQEDAVRAGVDREHRRPALGQGVGRRADRMRPAPLSAGCAARPAGRRRAGGGPGASPGC